MIWADHRAGSHDITLDPLAGDLLVLPRPPWTFVSYLIPLPSVPFSPKVSYGLWFSPQVHLLMVRHQDKARGERTRGGWDSAPCSISILIQAYPTLASSLSHLLLAYPLDFFSDRWVGQCLSSWLTHHCPTHLPTLQAINILTTEIFTKDTVDPCALWTPIE